MSDAQVEPRTIGISPKAIGAAVAGYVGPIVAGFLANKLGADVTADAATTFIAPLFTSAAAFVTAYLAKSGYVVATTSDKAVDVEEVDLGQTGRAVPENDQPE